MLNINIQKTILQDEELEVIQEYFFLDYTLAKYHETESTERW